jgi:FkbM family methyltransferase
MMRRELARRGRTLYRLERRRRRSDRKSAKPSTMTGATASDPHWQAIAEALCSARAVPATVLAPAGFSSYLSGVREYAADANLARLAVPEIAWLVVHKDHLAQLDGHGLAASLIGSRLVLANEVFGLFALASPESRADPHVASFIALLRDRPDPATSTGLSPTECDPAFRLQITDLGRLEWRSRIERYCESRRSALAMPDETVLCRVLGKYLMWVDAHDHGLSPHLIMQGYWEMWITQALARLAVPGTTAIDIGANVGYYTMLLADAVGPEGRVISFEPNPRIARMLGRSTSINGFASRVVIRNEAVSSSGAGSLCFAIPKHEPKNAALIIDEPHRQSFIAAFGSDLDFIDVPAVSLDSLRIENVGAVKIDAEGAEREIWNGMQETIKRNNGIRIVLEFNAHRLYEPMEFFDAMARVFPMRHIDFDGGIKPLTPGMVRTERRGEDWMLLLARD